jgi:hypothetical protein
MAIRKKEVARRGNHAVILMDSISYAGKGDDGVFAISASHGGKSSAHVALTFPISGVVFSDAGVGKDEAGIAGLALMDEKCVPAVAVCHLSAHIGDVEDIWANGVVSHVNKAAASAGFYVGVRLQVAVLGWLDRACLTAVAHA